MSRELLKRALDFIAPHQWEADDKRACYALVEEVEAELSKPDPEPVAWMSKTFPTTFAISEDIAQPAMFFTPLYAEPVDQSTQIAALKHELQQADEDYVSVEEAYLQCQKDLYNETEKLAALQSKREPLTDDQVREVYRTAFPRGPYVYTNDAFVFARAIEAAHGIGEII